MARARALLIRAGLALALALPVGIAATSPLLAWRDPVYIAGGFAGIAALALLPLQPLLARGWPPGPAARRGRRLHVLLGGGIALAVAAHVAGLWLTNPPDVVDALLLRAPAAFSAWGVAAMWALLAAGGLAALRRRLRLSPALWRRCHLGLACVAVLGSAVHAMLVVGVMETASKTLLCALAVAAAAWALRNPGARLAAPRRRA